MILIHAANIYRGVFYTPKYYSLFIQYMCFLNVLATILAPPPVEYPEKGVLRCLICFDVLSPGSFRLNFTRGCASSKCGGGDEKRRLQSK